MARAKSLEQQFHEAEAHAAEAQRTYEKARADYFLERREKIRQGEDPGPLVCLDGAVWQEQLAREAICRKNAEEDRRAGLAA